MRKELKWIIWTVFAAVTLTGCSDSSGSGDYEKVRPVEAGLYIHDAAFSQNEMALQPAGVAVRLAILRAEAVAQNKLPGDLDKVFVPGVGNLKTMLFGASTKITESGGVYEIEYVWSGGMNPYDSYARFGTVRVTTGGRALEDTDSATGWTVSLVSEQLIVSDGRKFTLTSTGGTTVCRKEDGYEIAFRDGEAYVNKAIVSKWTGTFLLTPEKSGGLSLSELKGSAFGFSGSAAGASFWTLNGTSSVKMSYALADGKYDPSLIGSPHLTGGAETSRLTDPADYDAAAYPSPEVTITWTLADKRLNYVVDYNGHSVGFTY